MAEATMAIVRDFQHPLDVMKVEIFDPETAATQGKPVYAVSEILWGAFRDVEERVGKYWIWGSLRSYAAYLFGSFKDLTWDCTAQFRYTLPCSGCRSCMIQDVIKPEPLVQQQQTRWWQAFVPRAQPAKGRSASFGTSLKLKSQYNDGFLKIPNMGKTIRTL